MNLNGRVMRCADKEGERGRKVEEECVCIIFKRKRRGGWVFAQGGRELRKKGLSSVS